jgi:predicted small secreted protein
MFWQYSEIMKEGGKMKKAIWVLIVLVIFAVLICGCATQDNGDGTDTQTDNGSPTPATDDNNSNDGNTPPDNIQPVDPQSLGATFAISNTDGNKLIAFALPANQDDYTSLDTAIGKKGEPLDIAYIGAQAANDQDNGRVNAWNFDNMQGNLYQITNPPVEADQTYFLYNSENRITENLLTPVTLNTTEVSSDALGEIATAKGRIVEQAWLLKEYDDKTQILLVLFEPDGVNLLMSIAFKVKDTFKFMDYPAVLNNNSAWRVDDGGAVDPRFFTVMFAVNTTDGVAAAISWAGAEGENTFFLIESDVTLIEMPDPAYRYWSAG